MKRELTASMSRNKKRFDKLHAKAMKGNKKAAEETIKLAREMEIEYREFNKGCKLLQIILSCVFK